MLPSINNGDKSPKVLKKVNDSVTKWNYISVLKNNSFKATQHTQYKSSTLSFRAINKELRYHSGHVY